MGDAYVKQWAAILWLMMEDLFAHNHQEHKYYLYTYHIKRLSRFLEISAVRLLLSIYLQNHLLRFRKIHPKEASDGSDSNHISREAHSFEANIRFARHIWRDYCQEDFLEVASVPVSCSQSYLQTLLVVSSELSHDQVPSSPSSYHASSSQGKLMVPVLTYNFVLFNLTLLTLTYFICPEPVALNINLLYMRNVNIIIIIR